MIVQLDLTKKKETLEKEISSSREASLKSGFGYLDNMYPCDETFQAFINSYLLSFSLNLRDSKEVVKIRKMDNTYTYMSYKELLDFAKQLFEYTDQVWTQSFEAKDTLRTR
jgi:hypothetical protein